MIIHAILTHSHTRALTHSRICVISNLILLAEYENVTPRPVMPASPRGSSNDISPYAGGNSGGPVSPRGTYSSADRNDDANVRDAFVSFKLLFPILIPKIFDFSFE